MCAPEKSGAPQEVLRAQVRPMASGAEFVQSNN